MVSTFINNKNNLEYHIYFEETIIYKFSLSLDKCKKGITIIGFVLIVIFLY